MAKHIFMIALALAVTPTQVAFMPSSASAQTRVAAVTAARPQAPVVNQSSSTRSAVQPQVPSPEAMTIMIRSSLLALSHANLTNNYSVLSALGAPEFRTANPPAKLAELFASFRANNIDLAPLSLVQPQLSQAPRFEGGKLRLTGLFATLPMRVNYDLTFEPTNGQWKLFGLAVNLQKVEPAR